MIILFWITAIISGINASFFGSDHLLALVLAWLAADWFTGFYHLLLDHFTWKGFPVLEQQAKDFQGHHENPMDITNESFSSIIKPASYAAVTVFLLSLFVVGFWAVFLFVFSLISALSQAFHRWAHFLPRNLPFVIRILMVIGVLISRKHHMTHHNPPYLIHYGIVSGWTNYITNMAYVPFIKWVKSKRG
jgi:ubiquitin-conjugating enzyme E2 variant